MNRPDLARQAVESAKLYKRDPIEEALRLGALEATRMAYGKIVKAETISEAEISVERQIEVFDH